jgi:dienelactone hydrolase
VTPPTLEELFSEPTVVDAAMSPSGRYIASIARQAAEDLLLVIDLETSERKVIQRAGFSGVAKNLEMKMAKVYWKSDDRLLLRLAVRPVEGIKRLSHEKIGRLGDRLLALDRDGGNVVGLLGDNRNAALDGSFNLGAIGSFLPEDPKHILMVLNGFNGRSLFKVNLDTGAGEQIERPSPSVRSWWVDLQGNAVVRVTLFKGTVQLHRKVGDEWKKFHSMRLREMQEREDYEVVGSSTEAGKFYVLARPPGHDKAGLYLYDFEKNVFGDPLVENPNYDIESAAVSRDGKSVRYTCHFAHVRICEFGEPKFDSHLRGLRKYFQELANVSIYDASEDAKALILLVQGPSDPPAFYYYTIDSKRIELVGLVRNVLGERARPQAAAVHYKARDGMALTGYLTTPHDVPNGTRLPLVMYPHGGPEARDSLEFDRWAQYFVSLGYAVFQPNFRGSDGFGRAFAESGYGEWGRKMQDDISDGLKDLVDRGVVDPARVCIVGASYGGYAALAGAALTPDLYKCAVSFAGVSDLEEFIGWRKNLWGGIDSEGYKYWIRAIGDPDTQRQRVRDVSPVVQVAKIRIPVLLVHGWEDGVVPIAQARMMRAALQKSGVKNEIIDVQDEGHSGWSDENEMYALSNMGAFLWKQLGAGHGMRAAPVARKPPPR